MQAGEFIALLGPSGCGKTTTLRMLAGFEQPDEGFIRISGEYVQGVPPHKRDVNTVFQNYALFPHMTVAENVAYGLRQKGVDKSEIIAARRRGARDGEDDASSPARKPRQMSGGQQQRVALARALVNRPSVLLLDEPLGALDRKLREEMQIELKLLQSQVGITFIFVTHDQEEALSMSDRIAVMLDGHVEQLADPDTIYDQPASAFVAGFIGQNNFLRGTAKGDGHELAGDGFTVIAGRAGARRDARPARHRGGAPGGDRARRRRPDQAVNAVRGTLAGVSHLGDVIQFVVIAAIGREMLSRQPRHEAPRLDLGADVWCTWDPDRAHLFGADQATLVMADPAV